MPPVEERLECRLERLHYSMSQMVWKSMVQPKSVIFILMPAKSTVIIVFSNKSQFFLMVYNAQAEHTVYRSALLLIHPPPPRLGEITAEPWGLSRGNIGYAKLQVCPPVFTFKITTVQMCLSSFRGEFKFHCAEWGLRPWVWHSTPGFTLIVASRACGWKNSIFGSFYFKDLKRNNKSIFVIPLF